VHGLGCIYVGSRVRVRVGSGSGSGSGSGFDWTNTWKGLESG
jgi:hypothetical protein